jgi:NTE family protein
MQLPDSVADSALAHLFTGDVMEREVTWFSLPGGQTLCEAGEVADQLFFLRAGRLGAIRREEGQEPQFLGVIRPGEPAGEMAMIAGTRHTATVVALRDSEILAMPRSVFLKAAEHEAEVMIELARLMMLRARQTATRTSIGAPSVFGFIGMTSEVAVRDLVEALAEAIGGFGYSVTTVGEEAQHAPTEWFSNVELAHDFVLYAAEAGQTVWKAIVGRQVDRLFQIGRGDRAPPPVIDRFAYTALEVHRFVDLVLVQPAGRERPTGSEHWMDAIHPARLFHLREGDREHLNRLARTLAGLSVGLVLSGGGARAYAQIGAIRALRAAKVPIDFVGGASMGAIIGAAVAMGWNDAEIDRRIRKAFVETSPVDDIAFPLIAMTRGEKVRARLREHFGDQDLTDLWLPFFCISSNLTTGAYQLHQRGRVRHALRASIAIPGLLPPATDGEDVLVDGAVMKNFPADVMRALHLGPIVGVDVTVGRSITASDVARPESVWRWILSGQWRKGPPIVSLLLRAATVTTGRDLVAAREVTDLLVAPKLEGVEIRDWDAYEPAVEAGRVATEAALARLDRPVVELRRRPRLADAELRAPASAEPG